MPQDQIALPSLSSVELLSVIPADRKTIEYLLKMSLKVQHIKLWINKSKNAWTGSRADTNDIIVSYQSYHQTHGVLLPRTYGLLGINR